MQDEGGQSNLWIAGVALIIIGSIATNFGTNLVSYDHRQVNDDKTENDSTAYSSESTRDIAKTDISSEKSQGVQDDSVEHDHWSWQRRIGTFSFVMGNFLIFAAFGFAAQSLLAALESVQFISNILFARYMHGEEITRRVLLSTASIISGNILVIVFADHSEKLLDSTEVINLYLTNTGYHAYLIIAGLSFFFFHCLFVKYHESRTVYNIMLWRHDFIEPLAFAISATLVGTQAVLNGKCISMFIQVSGREDPKDSEFLKPTVYITFVIMAILCIYWLKRLDLGLALFPPTFIIPVLQVFYMFFAIICGGIFFYEFSHFDAAKAVGFTFGVILILGGVYGLAPTHKLTTCQVVKTMMKQVDDIPENVTWFRHRLDERLAQKKCHPITKVLREELTRTSDDHLYVRSSVLLKYHQVYRQVEQEHAALEVYRFSEEVRKKSEEFSNNELIVPMKSPISTKRNSIVFVVNEGRRNSILGNTGAAHNPTLFLTQNGRRNSLFALNEQRRSSLGPSEESRRYSVFGDINTIRRSSLVENRQMNGRRYSQLAQNNSEHQLHSETYNSYVIDGLDAYSKNRDNVND